MTDLFIRILADWLFILALFFIWNGRLRLPR